MVPYLDSAERLLYRDAAVYLLLLLLQPPPIPLRRPLLGLVNPAFSSQALDVGTPQPNQ